MPSRRRAPRYLIRDRDASYGHAVTRRLAAMGFLDRPTAARSPWQSGHAERLIGSVRRECLDHVVIMDELHLRRSWPLMPTITTASELIGHWPRTHRFIASLRGLAPLRRDRSSAAFTINIAESNIRYAQGVEMKTEQIVRQYIPEHQASMRRLIEKLERQIRFGQQARGPLASIKKHGLDRGGGIEPT